MASVQTALLVLSLGKSYLPLHFRIGSTVGLGSLLAAMNKHIKKNHLSKTDIVFCVHLVCAALLINFAYCQKQIFVVL